MDRFGEIKNTYSYGESPTWHYDKMSINTKDYLWLISELVAARSALDVVPGENLADVAQCTVAELDCVKAAYDKNCKALAAARAELKTGDSWQDRATEYEEGGCCPSCFETDEAGHKSGCYIGELETLLDAARADLETARTPVTEWQEVALAEKAERERAEAEVKRLTAELDAARAEIAKLKREANFLYSRLCLFEDVNLEDLGK